MKILYVGYKNPSFLAVADYIEIALKDMGHDVTFIDHRKYWIPGRLRERWEVLERWNVERINRDIQAQLAEIHPDIFLVCGGYNLSPKTIQAAHKGGAVTAVWFADYPFLFERYAELVPYYDYFFTSGTDALERHHAAGNVRGHFLPFACLPKLHQRVELSDQERARYTSEVVFVGSCYPERIKLLSLMTDFDLAIWGPGWKEKLPADHLLQPFIRGGVLKTEEWIRAVSASKMALNYIASLGSDLDPSMEKMANSRVFELLGCGAFQVVDAKLDVLKFFQTGSEMVLFNNPEETSGLIRHYLAKPDEMEAIRRRARETAVKSHTYYHRLTELFQICGKT